MALKFVRVAILPPTIQTDHVRGARDEREGMTAADDLQKKIRELMPWFHGSIPRDQVEILLQPPQDGLFLVRKSDSRPGEYTLCVFCIDKVEYFHIKYNRNDKLYTIDDEWGFEKLALLIEHYQNDSDGLPTKLTDYVRYSSANLILFDDSNLPADLNSSPSSAELNSNASSADLNLSADDLKYFQKTGFIINKSDLKLGKEIGKGEFGVVVLGHLREKKVAVKTVKGCAKSAKQFLEEAWIMSKLKHTNLVELIGVAVDSSSVYLVIEFMGKGSLVDYLRSRGRLRVSKQEHISFATQICAGLAHLESKKVVHRDVAARNVLLSDDFIAKVCDFGLAIESKQVNPSNREAMKQEGDKFPVKWTAPEALLDSKFTNKSDMWSFGILLWEMYAFGKVPYPRIPLSDVEKLVRKGYRMEAPEGCPPEVYDIMKDAWHIDPDQRPTFKVVLKRLKSLGSGKD